MGPHWGWLPGCGRGVSDHRSGHTSWPPGQWWGAVLVNARVGVIHDGSRVTVVLGDDAHGAEAQVGEMSQMDNGRTTHWLAWTIATRSVRVWWSLIVLVEEGDWPDGSTCCPGRLSYLAIVGDG